MWTTGLRGLSLIDYLVFDTKALGLYHYLAFGAYELWATIRFPHKFQIEIRWAGLFWRVFRF